MGQFQNWIKTQGKLAIANPDDVFAYWGGFEAMHYEEFAAYERYIDREHRTPADLVPADILRRANAPGPYVPAAAAPPAAGDPPVPAAAGPPVPAAAGPPVPAAAGPPAPAAAGQTLQDKARLFAKDLDALSDRIFAIAKIEATREKGELFTHRQEIGQAAKAAAIPPGAGEKGCTVRLQLQTNFKMKGGKDTIATEVVDNPNGVTVVELDAAFARLEANSGLKKKMKDQLRAAYEIHKGAWGAYPVGKSTSVNFDEDAITTGGRPQGGYRLDVENIRAAPGKQNFI
jgi:hypothetical protein